jgi:putative transcriptional regulator
MTSGFGSGPGGAGAQTLTGRLLVATPLLLDDNFARAVVLVVDADEAGALGVVLNRPTDIEVAAVLPPWAQLCGSVPRLFTGGPVSPETALALGLLRTVPRVGEDEPPGWRGVNGAVGLVDLDADPDAVGTLLSGVRVYAGYAGWAPGQLEDEIAAEAWYVVDALYTDILSEQPERLWRSVLRRQAGPLAMVSAWTADPTRN